MLEEQEKIVAKINNEGKMTPQLMKDYLLVRPDRAKTVDDFLSRPPPRIRPPDKLLGLIDASIKI